MENPNPSPIKQYDILLRANHKSHRTIANAALDKVRKDEYKRANEINVPEMLAKVHVVIKEHLGDHVPFPTAWIGTDKVIDPQDIVGEETETTFLVGTSITNQTTAYSVYKATDKAIQKYNKDNGVKLRSSPQRRECVRKKYWRVFFMDHGKATYSNTLSYSNLDDLLFLCLLCIL